MKHFEVKKKSHSRKQPERTYNFFYLSCSLQIFSKILKMLENFQ